MFEGQLPHNHEANCVAAPVVIDILNAALPLLDSLSNLNANWYESQLAQHPGKKRANMLLMEIEDHLMNGGYEPVEVSTILHNDDSESGARRVRSRSAEYKRLIGVEPKNTKKK